MQSSRPQGRSLGLLLHDTAGGFAATFDPSIELLSLTCIKRALERRYFDFDRLIDKFLDMYNWLGIVVVDKEVAGSEALFTGFPSMRNFLGR